MNSIQALAQAGIQNSNSISKLAQSMDSMLDSMNTLNGIIVKQNERIKRLETQVKNLEGAQVQPRQYFGWETP